MYHTCYLNLKIFWVNGKNLLVNKKELTAKEVAE